MRLIRRYPVTATMAGLVLVIGVVSLLSDPFTLALRDDTAAVRSGQWWRLVTSLFLQNSSVVQTITNLVSTVIIGATLESRVAKWHWLALFFAGGVATNIILAFTHDAHSDSGTSAAIGAMIGYLVISAVLQRRALPTLAFIYCGGYAAFLAAVIAVSDDTAKLATAGCVVVLLVAHRFLPPAISGWVLITLTALAAGVLLVEFDAHGLALALGAIWGAIDSVHQRVRTR